MGIMNEMMRGLSLRSAALDSSRSQTRRSTKRVLPDRPPNLAATAAAADGGEIVIIRGIKLT
jgi:hypothetical protein